jgi:hypothetical protein
MALDFQQVREQVKQLGENAKLREAQIQSLRERACELLKGHANELEILQQRVQLVAQNYEPTLRCALPVQEPLDQAFPLPRLPEHATVLAADGSQINPDRHVEVDYCLINVGAIQMCYGSSDPPVPSILCRLLYDEALYTPSGTITEARLALLRDSNERKMLADLAERITGPVITFTDGPMELWGGKDGDSASEFQESLKAYKAVLHHLHELKVTTAGYVDKPSANLVVRLLEVIETPMADLPQIKDYHPLRGVSDLYIYRDLLAPGERSAIFAMQSQSVKNYTGPLGLHFFYLNVGRESHPWLARVEIPAWVADNPEMLDHLQAVLFHQCQLMGSRPYPYLLHRAHETAVVTQEEKAQVTQMIALELRRRGVEVGEQSYKQSAKGLGKRTRL